MTSQRAERYNEGKLRWSLIDFGLLEPMVRVLEYGERKYSRDNWKKGQEVRSLIDCTLRHLIAFAAGEDDDPESGLSHIGHAYCNLMFIQNTLTNKPELDDRTDKPGQVLSAGREVAAGYSSFQQSTQQGAGAAR